MNRKRGRPKGSKNKVKLTAKQVDAMSEDELNDLINGTPYSCKTEKISKGEYFEQIKQIEDFNTRIIGVCVEKRK